MYEIDSIMVSILIAAYNIEEYISRCLESCTNQTYSDIEIIVVNDGSTDNTAQVIDKYSQKDNRLIHLQKENGGLVSARKAGVERAHGKYIFFLDGDDAIPLDSIENLVNVLDDKCDIVLGNYYIIKTTGESALRSYYYDGGTNIEQINSIYNNSLWTLVGNLYSCSLFEKISFPDHLYKSIGEDLVTLTQLLFYASYINYTEKPTYCYYNRESSIIGEARKTSIWALGFGAFVATTNFLIEKKIIEEVKPGYLKLLRTFVTGYLVSRVDLTPYRNEMKKAIQFAINNWYSFRKKSSLFQKLLFIIAYTNLNFAHLLASKSIALKNH